MSTREAWIVAAARSPDRTREQGLSRRRCARTISPRPSSAPRSPRVPALPPALVEDVIVGCAQPAGEAGYNIGRVVALLAGLPDARRHDRQPLLRLVAPGDPDRRCTRSSPDEGDAFVCAGVERVSRFGKGKSDGLPDTKNPRFARRRRRPTSPTSTSRWARRPSGSPTARTSPARRWTPSPPTSQQRAVARAGGGRLRRGDRRRSRCPTARWSIATTALAPETTLEKLAKLEPVFRPDGRVTAGNACPLNDGAAAVVVMSSTRARELGIAPLARIVASAVSAIDPEIMGLGPIEATRRALARAKMSDRATSTWSRSTKRSRPRSSRPRARSGSTARSSTSTAARSPSGTRSA